MAFPEKHSASGVTIFSKMSALATKHQAVNLSQGFPDFPIDQELAEFLYEAALGNFNQYAPMAGLPLLRSTIAEDWKKRYSIHIDADSEITITPGATYGIYTAFTALLRPGDEVIVLEPAYDSYIPNIEMNGARPVCIPLSAPDFHVDWQRIREAVTTRTRALILNTPHNPTGTIWTENDWRELHQLVQQTSIYIISDEVYEQLVYDTHRHHSVLQYPELRSRSFAIFSFGKVFQNTGWKVGYVVAPPDLTLAFRRLHQYLVFSVNTPAQFALARYMQFAQPTNIAQLMQKKRDFFLKLVDGLPLTIARASQGTYFQIAGYESISNKPDVEFTEWLTRGLGVATIPVSAFYHNGKDDHLIRFCFAKSDETLETAAERLQKLKRL